MAYTPTEHRLGGPSTFAQIDSAANYTSNSSTAAANNWWPIGTILRGVDPTFGGGEFIYLAGVAGTTAGSVVTYDSTTGLTTLLPITTKNLDQPVAVSMAANTSASNFSWYQIEGSATIKKTAVKVNPTVALYGSATTGRLMPTAASGRQILNTRSLNTATVASATSTIAALIQRPFIQGAVL